MAPALLGGSQRGHEYLYWEFHEQGFFQAVRMGDWKGVRKQGAAIELYDLKNDVGESRDVSASEPGVLRRIAELMAAARTDSPDFPVTIRR
jgi:arylsulfatase A-like enzyme